MRTETRRKQLTVLALALAGGSLAACQVSLAAGAIGGSVALGLAVWLLVGLSVATTQTACVADPEPSPDPDVDALLDAQVGPCLSDASVGPCLSPPPPEFDGQVGPCLGAPLDDMTVGPDAYVGPCLSPRPEADFAVQPCLSSDVGRPPPDAFLGPCLSPPIEPDARVGPCLEPPAPDDAAVGPCLDTNDFDAAVPPVPGDAGVPPARPDARAALDRERAAVLDRLLAENRLPPDVAARLRKS